MCLTAHLNFVCLLSETCCDFCFFEECFIPLRNEYNFNIKSMTATQSSYINALRRFKQEYGSEYGITKIGFFGSVARGDQTEESDVDIILESPTASVYTLIGIKQKLEKIFNKQVDVVGKTEFTPKNFLARVEKEAVYV